MFTPIKLKDIKRGQRFVENCSGRQAVYEALDDAGTIDVGKKHGYTLEAKPIGHEPWNPNGRGNVDFFEAYDPCGYGLHLYLLEVQ